MRYTFLFAVILFIIASCKTQQDGKGNTDKYDPDKTYKLQLNPAAASTYHYDINNETEINLEVDDKKIKNTSETEVGLHYKIEKDSTGNFLFTMLYDKIRLKTKKNDAETAADAANASFTLDPVEKMIGILKNATIVSTITPGGEIISMTGYKEVGDKIMAGFAPEDVNSRKMAEAQWEKTIGEELVKKNMDQLFKIFPDSAVHLGDTWNLTSRQEGELSMIVKGHYKLKAINSEIALIESEGKITSTNTMPDASGIGNTVSTLDGDQQGQFEMETKTGMLISCKIKATMKGTIHVMGRDVPVTIETSVKMKGKKTENKTN
jgi:hypothetical protein